MKKNRLIFYSIFGLFHLTSFIFTVTLDNDTSFLLKMAGWVPAFKWITLFGLLLLVIDLIWSWSIQRENDREKKTLHHELNTLKAKLFDMQEAANKQTPPVPPKQNL